MISYLNADLLLFHSFHCIHFTVNQVRNQGFVRVEASVQSSYGVPEGQPQCKSSPLREEIQDVALRESKTVCVWVCVWVCVRAFVLAHLCNSGPLHLYTLTKSGSVSQKTFGGTVQGQCRPKPAWTAAVWSAGLLYIAKLHIALYIQDSFYLMLQQNISHS